MYVKLTSAFLLLLFLFGAVSAQDGVPDVTFGTGGFQRANYGQGKLFGTSVLRLSDGKFVVGGHQFLTNNNTNAITRFNADGTPDISFGENGTVVVRATFNKDTAAQMLELPNGNILVLSAGSGFSNGGEVQLYQLTNLGKIDSSFGVNGIVSYHRNSGSPHQTFPQQMHRLADGSILVLYIALADNLWPSIVKFNSNGTIDNSFGVNGVYKVVSTALKPYYPPVSLARMHVAADASAVLYWVDPRGASSTDRDSIHMERMLANGTKDLGFGTDGDGVIRRYISESRFAMADGITMTDGNLLFVLEAQNGADNDLMTYKVQPDGAAVAAYGTNGLLSLATLMGTKKVHRSTMLNDGSVMLTGTLIRGSESEIFTLKIGAAAQDYGYGIFGTSTLGVSGVPEIGGQTLENADGSLWVVGHAPLATSNNNALNIYKLVANGNPDNSFGNAGLLQVNKTRSTTEAQAMAIQPDGKIIAAGFAFRSQKRGLILSRFLNNGAPDLTFGNQGFIHMEIGTQDDANAIKVEPDGKILVIGNTFNSSSQASPYIARFNGNGTPDNTFGTNGVVVTHSGSGLNARAVVVMPDGKILLGINQFGTVRILRLFPDGTADIGFGTNGEVTPGFGMDNQFLETIRLQPDGKILVGGTARQGMNSFFAVARLMPDGVADLSFNATGVRTVAPYGTTNNGLFMSLQSDGKIVIGGSSSVPGGNHFSVARLLADGTTDTGFGDNGANYIALGTFSQAAKSIVMSDGRIVLAGLSFGGGKMGLAMACFNSDGSIYTGFGTNGGYTNYNDGEFKAIAEQPVTNKILAAGRITQNTVGDLMISRFSYTSMALPITWGSFTTQKQSRSVALSWSTVQELNARDFVLQHKAANGSWNNMSVVPAAGNSAIARSYSYLHTTPVSGINYYRIMQRDLDGRYTFSGIRTVVYSNQPSGKLLVMENIVSNGQLRVQVNKENRMAVSRLRLVNTNGQVVMDRSPSGSLDVLPVGMLSSGVYYLQYENEVIKIVIGN